MHPNPYTALPYNQILPVGNMTVQQEENNLELTIVLPAELSESVYWCSFSQGGVVGDDLTDPLPAGLKQLLPRLAQYLWSTYGSVETRTKGVLTIQFCDCGKLPIRNMDNFLRYFRRQFTNRSFEGYRVESYSDYNWASNVQRSYSNLRLYKGDTAELKHALAPFLNPEGKRKIVEATDAEVEAIRQAAMRKCEVELARRALKYGIHVGEVDGTAFLNVSFAIKHVR